MGVQDCLREALLYEREDDQVRCTTCERSCKIAVGKLGFCKTRKNIDGKLYTLEYGDIASMSANPIEKKPFFHFFPGSRALTVGSYGCNFTCPWCQNWEISNAAPSPARCNYVSPERFVRLITELRCQGTSISFNEPTLLLEYALEIFPRARAAGYYNTFVTNGYMSAHALRLLVEHGLDAMNVDIKGGEDAVKRYCGADVEQVWRNIRSAKRMGVHVELTTLIIPGVNDDEDGLRSIANRISEEVGIDTPWHVTQYYPVYQSRSTGLFDGRTPIALLERAWMVGKTEGLEYVYLGNVPGHPFEHTYCPRCGKLLIERYGFDVMRYQVTGEQRCPICGARIAITGTARLAPSEDR
ncbi:MAG TPA: AmmeMemoRadiSam system radical SAM enzyme [Methanomicrobia archaeon]|mgnify:CR=1 FL=1|nr:AmmeMemoRadiSam system radical SAM enzyme [Methanomicrobia archaeon]